MPSLFNYVVVEWPHFVAQIADPSGKHEVTVVSDGNRAVAASVPLPDWQPGMPLGRARRLYPQATFVRRNRAREDAAHTTLERRLLQFSPRLEAYRTGGILLQNPDIDGVVGFVTRHPVLRGAAAPNAEWAHLGVCTASPGTVRLVCNGAAFLAETRTSVLAEPGGPLGENGLLVAHRLGLFGLPNLGAVARRLSRRHLRVQFGPALGAHIDRILRPGRQPLVPYYQIPKEVSAVYELVQPSPVEATWIKAEILRLAVRVAEHLHGLAALTLSLQTFVLGRGAVSDSYLAQRGISSESDLQRLSVSLYERLCQRLVVNHSEALSFKLTAGKLTPQATVQGNLFTPRTEHPALKRAVLQLQQRYGDHVILNARPTPSLFVEKRLAMTPVRWEAS